MTTTTELLDQYFALKQQADAATEQMGVIKEKLASLFPDGGEHGGHKITVTRAGRIDEKAIQAALPAHDYPDLYKIVPNTTVIRKKISPEKLEPFLAYGKPSVRIS